METTRSTSGTPYSRVLDEMRKLGLVYAQRVPTIPSPDITHQGKYDGEPAMKEQEPSQTSSPTSMISASKLLVSGGTFNQTTKHHVTYHLSFPPLPSDAQVEFNMSSDSGSGSVHISPTSNSPPTTNNVSDPLLSNENSTMPISFEDFVSSLSQTSVYVTPRLKGNNRIYELNMLKKCRGYPLWVPECSQSLPIEKRRLGVDIGDVGLIDKDGCFVFLFNILLPIDHPFHPEVMPQGYTPVRHRSHDLVVSRPLRNDTALTSMSVRRLVGGCSSLEQKFEIVSSEGAVLALPEGAQTYRIQNVSKWEIYMARHIESWYEYVKVTLGYKANNGDIRLVTGCDKACSWGMAVAEQGPIFPHTYELEFREAVDKRGPVKHMWECNNGIVETRTGPYQEEVQPLLSDRSESDITWPPIFNQCLFVESLNNSLSAELWAKICIKTEDMYNEDFSSSPSTAPQDRDHHDHNSPSNAAPDTSKGKGPATSSRSSPNDSQSDFVGTNQILQALYTDHHPVDRLCKFMLSLFPQAQVAILNDRRWCVALGGIPESISNGFWDLKFYNDLICALLLENSFELKDDMMVHLVPSIPPVDSVFTTTNEEIPFRGRVKELAERYRFTKHSHHDIHSEQSKSILKDTAYIFDRLIYVVNTGIASFRASEGGNMSESELLDAMQDQANELLFRDLQDEGSSALNPGRDSIGNPLRFFPCYSSTYLEIFKGLGSMLKIMQYDLHWHDSIADIFDEYTDNSASELEHCRDQLGIMAGTSEYQAPSSIARTSIKKSEIMAKPAERINKGLTDTPVTVATQPNLPRDELSNLFGGKWA
ncbi:hypothetical protein BJ165DRAFT_1609884 [Panaeolus papilionaceus]|nr:hypothetical protein BJ165DRAFT_1609884 [Panaeolus papilionaceus]